MPGSWLVALALMFAPPSAESAAEESAPRNPACAIWWFPGEPYPRPEPTATCPSWTIYESFGDPFTEDSLIDLRPTFEGWRLGCRLRLVRVRLGFVEVMTHQAAGVR